LKEQRRFLGADVLCCEEGASLNAWVELWKILVHVVVLRRRGEERQ